MPSAIARGFCNRQGGIVGQDGATHHGSFDMSYLRHIPNMVVASPKDENELSRMLYSAVVYGRTMAIRYPRGEAFGVPCSTSSRRYPSEHGRS